LPNARLLTMQHGGHMTTNERNAWDDLDLTPAPAVYKVGFTIPGIPVAKGRPRFSTQGGFVRAYTPEKTRDFEAMAREYGRAAMGPLTPCMSSVQATFVVFVPVPKSWTKAKRNAALAGGVHPTCKPDLDNFAKALTDALNGVVYDDDSQICDVVMSKRYADEPRIVVSFWAKEGFTIYRQQRSKRQ
jgi:Holliday junction resolvase RusA-like endonuclease